MTEKFDAMVCTVGENPLPVYLGIAQLTKPDATIVLLHSEGTEGEAKRIANCLGSRRKILMGARDGCLIKNPWDFESVFATITFARNELLKDFSSPAINITGGTNIMTGIGMTIWIGQDNYNVIYLEEKENQFRIGNGRSVPLIEDFSLDILRDLHGVVEAKSSPKLPKNSDVAARNLYQLFQLEKLFDIYRAEQKDIYDDFRNPKFSPLYKWIKDEGGNAIWEAVRSQIPVWSDQPVLPHTWKDFVKDPTTNELHETGKRIHFASGFWMEHLVYMALKQAAPDALVIINQEFTIQDQLFEVDILAIVNNRFYNISVTTQSYHKIVKGKAFEAMHRARQIGGGLARSAVVSTIHNLGAEKCQTSVDPSKNPRHRILPAPPMKRLGRHPDFTFHPIEINDWNKNLVIQFQKFFDDQG
ncbi:hypothetical protein [Armatimonas sp.]|uniref:hypothetical protein n=1 Tax=Armatimonas sp. TaxID=1872638 RepID=UPI00374CDAB5